MSYLLMIHVDESSDARNRFGFVVSWDNVSVLWDSEYGVYWLYEDYTPHLWTKDIPVPDDVMWSHQFEREFKIYDGREPPYLLFKHDETYEHIDGKRSYRYHIVRDGEPICQTNVSVSGLPSDEFVPVDEIEDEEWERIRFSKLCTHCSGRNVR